MAKEQANYPNSLDVLNVDRLTGQVVPSSAFDILEDAVTEIEEELRRVTTKTAAATLTANEGGLVLVSCAVTPYTLGLPSAVGNNGLTYDIIKTDDNTNLITIDADGTETINGQLTFTDLNYQYARIKVKSDNVNWHILSHSTNNIAVTTNKLSVFAATTSAELAGVISNETGSGALVFGTSPTIASPTITGELGGELDCGAHTVGFTLQSTTGDGTTTIDWRLGNKFKFTFGAQNETFTFTAPTNPCTLMLTIIQDGTGSRTVTFPATVKWAGGSPPTLSTAANARDKIALDWDGTQYDAVASLAFS